MRARFPAAEDCPVDAAVYESRIEEVLINFSRSRYRRAYNSERSGRQNLVTS
jgi:hypothetical protein